VARPRLKRRPLDAHQGSQWRPISQFQSTRRSKPRTGALWPHSTRRRPGSSGPGQPKNLWPLADISGALVGGDRFLVEIDDHADPVRSIVKYWPLLEGVANGAIAGHRIRLVGASRRDSTFGEGFQILASSVRWRSACSPLPEALSLLVCCTRAEKPGCARC
jgi:hypothetical protein